ncbi:5817_t:CDS:2 [Ambispora gerdemannii]|uniref:5817_t:CDS:1 n=1 Tax=Ambispora gerdemannii TaxID=144530 RepID=A0A9N9B585_9GLOM|nr:5817_t:CDS:2 [Ambispora gerdemannii]
MKKVKNVILRRGPFGSKKQQLQADTENYGDCNDSTRSHKMHSTSIYHHSKGISHKNFFPSSDEDEEYPSPPPYDARFTPANYNNEKRSDSSETPVTPMTPLTPLMSPPSNILTTPTSAFTVNYKNIKSPSQERIDMKPKLTFSTKHNEVDLHFVFDSRAFVLENCKERALYYLCSKIRDAVEPALNIKINPLLLELNIPRVNLIQVTITNKLLSEEGGMYGIIQKYGICKENPLKVEILGNIMERTYSHSSEEDWPHQMECEGHITITPQLPNFVIDLFNCLSYKFEGNKKEMISQHQDSTISELPECNKEEAMNEVESDPELFTSVLDKLARRLGGNNLAVCNKKDGIITSFGAKFNAILDELHEFTGTQTPQNCCPWILRQSNNNTTIIEKVTGTTSSPAIMQWLQYTIDFVCLLWDAERGSLLNNRAVSMPPELPALQLEGSIKRNIKVPNELLNGSFIDSMLFKQQQDSGITTIRRRDVSLLTKFRPEMIFPRIYSTQDLLLQDADLDDIRSSEETTQFIPQFKSNFAVELQSPKLHMVRLGNLYKHCDECSHYEDHSTSTDNLRSLIMHRTAFGGPYGAVIKRHGMTPDEATEITLNPIHNCIHKDDPYVPLESFKDDGYIVFGVGGPTSRDGGKIPSLRDLCRRSLILQGKIQEPTLSRIDKSKERLCSGCQKWFFNPAETIILWTAAQDYYCGMLVIGHYCAYQCVPLKVRENIKKGVCPWER